MPITISIVWRWGGVEGKDEVFRSASNLFLDLIHDKTGLWRQLSRNVFHPAVSENFASQGSAGGAPWAALAPATVKKRGSSEPILHDTGALEESFDEVAAGHVEKFDAEGGEWGTEIVDERGRGYSVYHQISTEFMPARPILYWNEAMSAQTEDELRKFVLAAAAGIWQTTEGGVPLTP